MLGVTLPLSHRHRSYMLRTFINTFFYIILISSTACNSSQEITEKCYKNTRTIVSSYGMGKMVDNYFDLKKGNYFQYSRRLLGLTKVEVYNGSYKVINDTIILKFCNNTMPDGLTGKGLFGKTGRSITLFTNSITDQNFII